MSGCLNCGKFCGEVVGNPLHYCDDCRPYQRKRYALRESIKKHFKLHHQQGKDLDVDKLAKLRRGKDSAEAALDRFAKKEVSER